MDGDLGCGEEIVVTSVKQGMVTSSFRTQTLLASLRGVQNTGDAVPEQDMSNPLKQLCMSPTTTSTQS